MNKKNRLFARISALLCAIALPLHTFSGERPQSSYRPRPTFTRRRTSTGPQRSKNNTLEKKQTIQQIPLVSPTQTEEEMIPTKEEEPTTGDDEKNTETTPAEKPSKVMTFVYATLIPVLLLSLSKAFEKGLDAVTKKTIKNFMNRDKFIDLNQQAELFAPNSVDKLLSIANSIQPNEPGYANATQIINIPRQELINQAKSGFFKKHKMDFEQASQESSLSYILSQASSTGTIYTAVSLITGLIGLGFTLAINYLVPKKE